MRKAFLTTLSLGAFIFFLACENGDEVAVDPIDTTGVDTTNTTTADCEAPDFTVSTDAGPCTETLMESNSVNITMSGGNRVITANNIPSHMVGLFGGGMGSLNPNAITAQNNTYTITASPTAAASITSLLNTSMGPAYAFGVALNGVKLDPVAAEPFPNSAQGTMDPNVNWEWNLEALNLTADLGLDCNYAHVQPNGEYHYHGIPTMFLDGLNINGTSMVLVGWAADGYPIYYKYAYTDASNSSSAIKALSPSYRLKSGTRPGDGVTAPCGDYDGIYSNDYEYVDGLGDLDECNGRTGVTPEFPGGTYYYVITDDYPAIPRCLMGTPSNDFRTGG